MYICTSGYAQLNFLSTYLYILLFNLIAIYKCTMHHCLYTRILYEYMDTNIKYISIGISIAVCSLWSMLSVTRIYHIQICMQSSDERHMHGIWICVPLYALDICIYVWFFSYHLCTKSLSFFLCRSSYNTI